MIMEKGSINKCTTLRNKKETVVKLLEWIYQPSADDHMNHVELYVANSNNATTNHNRSIDIGLLMCLIAISDYKSIYNHRL